MTDWKSPAVAAADYFALVKLCHIMAGILIWEFVVYIGFEYSFFAGKRKFRSSFLTGPGLRDDQPKLVHIALLGGSVVPSVRHYCYTRGIQLSKPDQLLVIFISLDDFCLGTDRAAHYVHSFESSFQIFQACDPGSGVVVLRATWSGGICKITNPSETRSNIPVTFVTDLVLLVLMLTGLLRWENAHQRGGVWWLLLTTTTGLGVDDNRCYSGGTYHSFHSVEPEWCAFLSHAEIWHY
ncbi:hypothetical protein EDB87DRAFT_1581956 [Lactarius vividus]|nr:hypothetical protein EDB87DRAFT_1581956 [Lactarius vividus]